MLLIESFSSKLIHIWPMLQPRTTLLIAIISPSHSRFKVLYKVSLVLFEVPTQFA